MRNVNDASCELLGEFFSTIAHASRIRILCTLQDGPRTVTEIALRAKISVPNASQHLRLMRDRGAVLAQKRAQNVYYQVADPRILHAMMLIRESMADHLQRTAARASVRVARPSKNTSLQPA